MSADYFKGFAEGEEGQKVRSDLEIIQKELNAHNFKKGIEQSCS